MLENIRNVADNFSNPKLFGGKKLTDNVIKIKVIDEKETEEQKRTKLKVR